MSDNGITDQLADAIIGAILIGRLAYKTAMPGIQNGKDLTPKPGTKVFTPTPGLKPGVPIPRREPFPKWANGRGTYTGSADAMERQEESARAEIARESGVDLD